MSDNNWPIGTSVRLKDPNGRPDMNISASGVIIEAASNVPSGCVAMRRADGAAVWVYANMLVENLTQAADVEKKPLVFSFSLLDTFHNVCKKQAHHKFILRDVKSTYTQQDGIDAHKCLEDRLKTGAALPAPLLKVEPIMASLTAPGLKRAVEIKMGLSYDYRARGFFDSDVRWRAVADLIVHREGSPKFLEFDWKTGKPRDNELQHRINSILTFAHYPRAEEVTTANIYTKSGTMGERTTYYRDNIPEYTATLEALAAPIVKETEWLPTEGPLCGWCPVTSCAFNRVKP